MTSATLRGSLRFRLLLGTLFWIAASILAAGWGLGNMFRQHVELQFHAELKTHLDQLTAQLALDDQGRPTLAMPLSDPRLNKPFAGLYWQIDRLAGAGFPAAGAVMRSRSLWDQVLLCLRIARHRRFPRRCWGWSSAPCGSTSCRCAMSPPTKA
jgi:hypothetical protein